MVVKFASDATEHDTDNVFTEEDLQSSPELHFGLIKSNRTYRLDFTVKSTQEVEIVPSRSPTMALREVEGVEGPSRVFQVRLETLTEGHVADTVTIRVGQKEIPITVKATIMGKNAGTPLLKKGVRCVHVHSGSDEETEWSGFD
eukprot:comp97352_c0_seq1/m.48664 comp97352_c0_seq1/g.48664  ORF comp97352_c0_seq1/g.48664 comp97352_c0_seq1/m.48664 type:complete len:144 (-) comp97352_c0_seq1:35-466(-)